MAVSGTSVVKSFTGNNSTSTYYPLLPEIELQATSEVKMRVEGGAELVNGVDFTVSLTQGVLTTSARPATETLHIWRETPDTQDKSLSATETPKGTVVESALDKQARTNQEARHGVRRALRVPHGETLNELAEKASRMAAPYGRWNPSTGQYELLTAAQLAAAILPELNLGTSTPDRPTAITADAAGRAALVPAFTGQLLIQLDDFSQWHSTGTSAGNWAPRFGAIIYVWAGGQSNMLNRDDATNATNHTWVVTEQVKVWRPSQQDWQAFDPASAQFTNDVVGRISPAMYAALDIARFTGAEVRVFMVAKGATAISGWVPTSGSEWAAFATDYSNAGNPHISFALWHQGESDRNSLSGNSIEDYRTSLNTLITQLRALGTRGTSTIFVAGTLQSPGRVPDNTDEVNPAILSLQSDGNPLNRVVDFRGLASMDGQDLEGTDAVHFNHDSAIAMGHGFAAAALSPPEVAVPGVIFDLDARRGITTSSGTITAIEDKTRGIQHTSISGSPKLETDRTGRPYIRFNSGYFRFPVQLNQPCTIFARLTVYDDASNNLLFDCPGRLEAYYRTTNRWAMLPSADTADLQESSAAAVRAGRPTVVCFEFDGTRLRCHELDTLHIDATAAGGDDPTSGDLYIGATSAGASTSEYFNLYRLTVYNGILSAQERDSIIRAYDYPEARAVKIFDVSAEEGVTGSAPVTGWADLARNLSATVTGSPQLGTDSAGNKYIDMNTGGRFQFTLATPKQMTVIAKVEINNNATAEVILNTDNTDERIFQYRSTNAFALSVEDGALDTEEAAAAVNPGAPTTVLAEFNGPASRVLERGELLGALLTTLGFAEASTSIYIGDTDTASANSAIKIYRLMIFNGLLDDAEIDAHLSSF